MHWIDMTVKYGSCKYIFKQSLYLEEIKNKSCVNEAGFAVYTEIAYTCITDV